MFRIRGGVLVAALGLAFSAEAQGGLPHTFVDGTPALADEVNANFRYVAPENVVYVNAQPDADVANGNALHDALASLASIGGPPGPGNRYLVKLRPGIYDLGNRGLVLPRWVFLEGVSERATALKSTASTAITLDIYSGLRSFSLDHVGGGSTSIHVKSTATSGVWPTFIRDIWLTTEPTSRATGILAEGAVTVVLRDLKIHTHGRGQTYGIHTTGNAYIDAVDVDCRVTNTNSSGAARALFLDGSGRAKFHSSILGASGPQNEAYALGTGSNYSGILHVMGSQVTGSSSIFGQFAGSGKVYVATSELGGSHWVGSASNQTAVKCVYVYNHQLDALSRCDMAPF